MRLTLRTMLAFLDDVLEPADAEDLSEKIESSEFASGLVHRIRNSARKLRLGAPKLAGKGMGLDPNTVAEYLDSTLSPERVPDFEKVCLESDVHLAEVASCHQVLTLVLGEPADVPPAMRDRIYDVGSLPVAPPESAEEKGQEAADANEPPPPPVADEDGGKKIEKKPTEEKVGLPDLPDYMAVSSRRRLVPLLITALLVFLITAGAFFAIGPERLTSMFGGGNAPAEGTRPETSGESTSTVKPAPAVDATSTDTSSGPVADVNPGGDDSATSGVTSPEPTGDKRDGSGDDPPEPSPIPGVTTPKTTITVDGPPAPKGSGTSEDKAPGSAPTRPAPRPVPVRPIPSPATVSDVGRHISENQVIARFDGEAWVRLPTDAPLLAGNRLLVPPTYRPRLAMTPDVQVKLVGPALVELSSPDEGGFPNLTVDYGRAIFSTVGRVGTEIHLNLAGRQGIAKLANADAVVAVEVRYHRMPGVDPEEGKLNTIVQITAVQGMIQWQEDEPYEINAGQVHVLVDEQPGVMVAADTAAWIANPDIRGIDQTASEVLERQIDLERPLLVSLEEKVTDDRFEIRALASRCLSYLGRHESFVSLMGDPQVKAFWELSYDTAQDALARGPESAAQMRTAFERMRGDHGAELYRLLVGVGPEGLPAEAPKLVAYLSHDSLDYRVLAYINLKRITGLTKLYQPQQTEARRSQSVRRWQQMADEGTIVFRSPPALPLPGKPDERP